MVEGADVLDGWDVEDVSGDVDVGCGIKPFTMWMREASGEWIADRVDAPASGVRKFSKSSLVVLDTCHSISLIILH